VPKDTYPVQWVGQQALVALPEYIDVSNAGRIRGELLAVLNRGAEAGLVPAIKQIDYVTARQ